jgi:hypothetical protein
MDVEMLGRDLIFAEEDGAAMVPYRYGAYRKLIQEADRQMERIFCKEMARKARVAAGLESHRLIEPQVLCSRFLLLVRSGGFFPACGEQEQDEKRLTWPAFMHHILLFRYI